MEDHKALEVFGGAAAVREKISQLVRRRMQELHLDPESLAALVRLGESEIMKMLLDPEQDLPPRKHFRAVLSSLEIGIDEVFQLPLAFHPDDVDYWREQAKQRRSRVVGSANGQTPDSSELVADWEVASFIRSEALDELLPPSRSLDRDRYDHLQKIRKEVMSRG